MPEYIKICIESMRRYCPDFELITPETEDGWLEDAGLNPAYKFLNNSAHRADAIRVAVINCYGGLWVDCDTVFINPISKFEEYVDFIRAGFIFTRWSDGRCLNGYFWGTRKNPVTSEWLSKINDVLGKRRNFQWTSIGEKILTPIINSGAHRNVVHEMDRRVFLPINFDKIPWVFAEPLHWSSFVTQGTVAIGLNHSWMNEYMKPFVRSSEPWEGDGLIHSIIREAR